jgi:hypothetical protein
VLSLLAACAYKVCRCLNGSKDKFSAPVHTGFGVHPSSCAMGTGAFPGGKETGAGGGVALTKVLAPRLKKE